jgi:hypothetical protein
VEPEGIQDRSRPGLFAGTLASAHASLGCADFDITVRHSQHQALPKRLRCFVAKIEEMFLSGLDY